jgi:hypothetical protein
MQLAGSTRMLPKWIWWREKNTKRIFFSPHFGRINIFWYNKVFFKYHMGWKQTISWHGITCIFIDKRYKGFTMSIKLFISSFHTPHTHGGWCKWIYKLNVISPLSCTIASFPHLTIATLKKYENRDCEMDRTTPIPIIIFWKGTFVSDRCSSSNIRLILLFLNRGLLQVFKIV